MIVVLDTNVVIQALNQNHHFEQEQEEVAEAQLIEPDINLHFMSSSE